MLLSIGWILTNLLGLEKVKDNRCSIARGESAVMVSTRWIVKSKMQWHSKFTTIHLLSVIPSQVLQRKDREPPPKVVHCLKVWSVILKLLPILIITLYSLKLKVIFPSFSLIDAVREVRKYSSAHAIERSSASRPAAYEHTQMKLFRSQRNLYISGFSLFFWL